MAPTQRQEGGSDFILFVYIVDVKLAKEACRIRSARTAFASVFALLTTIRVCFLLRRQTYASRRLGYDGKRSGLCRAWEILR